MNYLSLIALASVTIASTPAVAGPLYTNCVGVAQQHGQTEAQVATQCSNCEKKNTCRKVCVAWDNKSTQPTSEKGGTLMPSSTLGQMQEAGTSTQTEKEFSMSLQCAETKQICNPDAVYPNTSLWHACDNAWQS